MYGADWTWFGRYGRSARIRAFDDDLELDTEFVNPRFLNPPDRTFYLGRGRRGDTNRLHRAIMLFGRSGWRP